MSAKGKATLTTRLMFLTTCASIWERPTTWKISHSAWQLRTCLTRSMLHLQQTQQMFSRVRRLQLLAQFLSNFNSSQSREQFRGSSEFCISEFSLCQKFSAITDRCP